MRLSHVCGELIKELVAVSHPVNRTTGSAAVFPKALERNSGEGVGRRHFALLCTFLGRHPIPGHLSPLPQPRVPACFPCPPHVVLNPQHRPGTRYWDIETTNTETALSSRSGRKTDTKQLYICCGEGDAPTPVLLENPMDGGAWWAAVHGVAKSRTRLSDFTFTFHFHALQKEMATHSSVLAWRLPGTGEPDRLPSMGSHRVGHN